MSRADGLRSWELRVHSEPVRWSAQRRHLGHQTNKTSQAINTSQRHEAYVFMCQCLCKYGLSQSQQTDTYTVLSDLTCKRGVSPGDPHHVVVAYQAGVWCKTKQERVFGDFFCNFFLFFFLFFLGWTLCVASLCYVCVGVTGLNWAPVYILWSSQPNFPLK